MLRRLSGRIAIDPDESDLEDGVNVGPVLSYHLRLGRGRWNSSTRRTLKALGRLEHELRMARQRLLIAERLPGHRTERVASLLSRVDLFLAEQEGELARALWLVDVQLAPQALSALDAEMRRLLESCVEFAKIEDSCRTLGGILRSARQSYVDILPETYERTRLDDALANLPNLTRSSAVGDVGERIHGAIRLLRDTLSSHREQLSALKRLLDSHGETTILPDHALEAGLRMLRHDAVRSNQQSIDLSLQAVRQTADQQVARMSDGDAFWLFARSQLPASVEFRQLRRMLGEPDAENVARVIELSQYRTDVRAKPNNRLKSTKANNRRKPN